MQDLKPRIHENGMDYVLVGDYYVPDLKLPEEHRPLGKWGRMHREYLRITNLGLLNELILSGKLWAYLADLNEQATDRCNRIIRQMMEAEQIGEDLKARDQMAWVRAMNSIRSRAEEIIKKEMIYC
ncbi:TnpV protein [Evtepia gabavorous]|uniref:TnpV protein n=1 Tax=Evtepia gabavorous TaxID=2211183 RepID=UPI003991183B